MTLDQALEVAHKGAQPRSGDVTVWELRQYTQTMQVLATIVESRCYDLVELHRARENNNE